MTFKVNDRVVALQKLFDHADDPWSRMILEKIKPNVPYRIIKITPNGSLVLEGFPWEFNPSYWTYYETGFRLDEI